MILLLNGAFGIGKTTVARALVAKVPNSILFDPELIGIALQRAMRLFGREVGDFQDLRIWRRLTILALRVTRLLRANVVVPMAFSNVAYLEEIRAGLARFEPRVVHVCLIAPIDVVQQRIAQRRLDPADAAWQQRRAIECCEVHGRGEFATHVDAHGRGVEEIADEIRAVMIAS